MKDAIIVVDNVSMKFNLAKEKVDSIKEYIIRAFKGKLEHDEFWGRRWAPVLPLRGLARPARGGRHAGPLRGRLERLPSR